MGVPGVGTFTIILTFYCTVVRSKSFELSFYYFLVIVKGLCRDVDVEGSSEFLTVIGNSFLTPNYP